ncbi:MAG: tetratricopeptide repeat protein [Planctomycetota bacterium]
MPDSSLLFLWTRPRVTPAARRVRQAGGLCACTLATLAGIALLAPRAGFGADDGDAPPAPTPPVAVARTESDALLAPDPSQQKEEMAFLKGIETSVNTGDGSAYTAALDTPVILYAANRGLGVSEKDLAKETEDFEKKADFGGTVAAAIKSSHGSFHLDWVKTVDGQRRALFRLVLGGKGGMNFHEVVLMKDSFHHYRIRDIYIATEGAMLSAGLHHEFEMSALPSNPALHKSLSANELELIGHAKDIDQLHQLDTQEHYADAIKLYKAMPPPVKRDRTAMMWTVIAAAAAGDKATYDTLSRSYAAAFPHDTALDLNLLDIYFLKQKYEQTVNILDHLEARLGPDGILLCIHARCLLELGKTDASAKIAGEAVDADPTLEAAYDRALSAELLLQHWGRIADLLDRYQKNLGRPLPDLEKGTTFQAFLQTADGKKYLADHPTPPAKH